MSSPFNTLALGYSALTAAQIGVDTTGHNIANAESEGYTRQRVVNAAAVPVNTSAGNVGNGVQVINIARIFDSFVFDRFIDVTASKEHSDFTKSILNELSSYFPEIDGVGIKVQLSNYYDMWQTFADNPDNDAMKLSLSREAVSLSTSIRELQDRVVALQKSVNDQMVSNVNEINQLAKELADINKEIGISEAGNAYMANDLRDKRSSIEEKLSKLIGAKALNGQIESNTGIDSNLNEGTGSYSLSVGGFNIVDGASYHPIKLESAKNQDGYYDLYYERQDGSLIYMSDAITGGRVGAMLDLRGRDLQGYSYNSKEAGVLQDVIAELDAFAKGIIESTNNLYAASSATRMDSNSFMINSNDPISSMVEGIKNGSFDVVIYDVDGSEVARRSVVINSSTTFSGAAGTNSIEGQISKVFDDNNDGNANNDVNSFLKYDFKQLPNGSSTISFSMDQLFIGMGYRFAIEDNLTTSSYDSGSNFAGALGLNRFFDGNDARSMKLNADLERNPTKIAAGFVPLSGDSRLALGMVQQQFEKYSFRLDSSVSFSSTIYAMFDTISTEVGIKTKEARMANDTIVAKYNATELEFSSISKVSIDEELTNLIRYQTSYGAASKIITTIDQMMQTLLGLKT
ncbi:MAG: flagellar hook-associated protein FlgK [Sulfuricurvum sp.]